ncbi:hypothetical protein SRABI106_04608 [Rahnella aquatilis]|nr:hypothetical protein SRABI106_04608 [Rahnella aquatilis]
MKTHKIMLTAQSQPEGSDESDNHYGNHPPCTFQETTDAN